MTIEELKSEAKKMGYKLIKNTRSPKLLPCMCGCNKRTEWFNCVDAGITLECKKCGLTAGGKNRTEAIIAWNLLIKEKTDG